MKTFSVQNPVLTFVPLLRVTDILAASYCAVCTFPHFCGIHKAKRGIIITIHVPPKKVVIPELTSYLLKK